MAVIFSFEPLSKYIRVASPSYLSSHVVIFFLLQHSVQIQGNGAPGIAPNSSHACHARPFGIGDRSRKEHTSHST